MTQGFTKRDRGGGGVYRDVRAIKRGSTERDIVSCVDVKERFTRV